MTVRRRTPVDRALSFVKRLNEPRERRRRRMVPTLREQVEAEFREAQRKRA